MELGPQRRDPETSRPLEPVGRRQPLRYRCGLPPLIAPWGRDSTGSDLPAEDERPRGSAPGERRDGTGGPCHVATVRKGTRTRLCAYPTQPPKRSSSQA